MSIIVGRLFLINVFVLPLNTNQQNEILVNETNNFKIPYFLYIFYDEKKSQKSMKNKAKILNKSESFNLTQEALKAKQK